MANIARFDTHVADAYISKTVSAQSVYHITFDVWVPSRALASIRANAGFLTGNFVDVPTGVDDQAILGRRVGAIWYVNTYGTQPTAQTLPYDAWFTVDGTFTYTSGTLWDVVWKINGTTVATDSGSDLGQNSSATMAFAFGSVNANYVTNEEQFIRNVVIKNGSGTVLFSDDFTGGTFGSWTTTSGSASIVSDSTLPAAVPLSPFPSGSAPHGVSVAFGEDALAASPSWSYLDQVTQRWRVRRGRSYMTDRTEAGSAEAEFVDTAGQLDPTNSAGPFYPMNPNCPFAIGLKNPVASTWTTIFRGMLQQMPTTMDISERLTTGTLMADDLFSLLAAQEIPKSVDFDSGSTGTNSANTIGDTTYAAQDVQSRIEAVLADAGVPSAMTSIFSGNVNVQPTTEPPGTTVLSMLWDAADAEFPAVSNLFIGKDGVVNFRGRLARFNPTDPRYDINTWHVGDTAAVAAHSSWALISGMTFDRDTAKIINDASFQPQGIADTDIAGQTVQNTGSIAQYGTRSLTGQDLITAGGVADGRNAKDETKLFSSFFVDNFHDAQTRITQLTFRGQPNLDAPNAAAQWLFLCGVEISDQVIVTTSHPGGGGFNLEPYFVEGISYEAEPMGLDPDGDPLLDVTMTLDLSPAGYYTTNPF